MSYLDGADTIERPAEATSTRAPLQQRVVQRPEVRGKFLFAGDEKLWVRGVTYGTFADGGFPDRPQVEADFEAMHAAGVTLMRGNPALVADAIDISRRSYHKIRQNLFWAFFYNAVGIPLAAFGMLSPVIAGAAMALSSVSVVTNALMLRRWKGSNT